MLLTTTLLVRFVACGIIFSCNFLEILGKVTLPFWSYLTDLVGNDPEGSGRGQSCPAELGFHLISWKGELVLKHR